MLSVIRAVQCAYESGVTFTCGCSRDGLQPRVIMGLVAGSISVVELLLCPVHGAPITTPITVTAPDYYQYETSRESKMSEGEGA